MDAKSNDRQTRIFALISICGIAGIAAAVIVAKLQNSPAMSGPQGISHILSPTAGEGREEAPARYVPRPPGTLTFCKDIAPVIWSRCTGCHRSGESAPFSLQTFSEIKRRISQIAEITTKRIMPPR